jgi:modification methylase
MSTVSGDFGQCEFRDCIEGMKAIPDKSIDLAFADPPYNIEFKGFVGSPSKSNSIKTYDDVLPPEQYRDWCKTWFAELQRISSRQIISPGLANLNMWYRDQEVTDIFGIIDKTGSFGSRIALFATMQPLIFFGKFPKGGTTKEGILYNCYEVVHVFRSQGKHEWVHPTPRPIEVLKYLLEGLQPKSVIDPFLGSGTTAQVAEELGIKWQGLEINEKYKVDIEKRIGLGKESRKLYKFTKQTKQKTLWNQVLDPKIEKQNRLTDEGKQRRQAKRSKNQDESKPIQSDNNDNLISAEKSDIKKSRKPKKLDP